MAEGKKRYAVVTGANKGIGFGTVKQLASQGITVILTARNEQRGLDALQKIKDLKFTGEVLFHQLDVADQDSVNHFSDFIKNNFGKLDILVNNAGVSSGNPIDVDKVKEALSNYVAKQSQEIVWKKIYAENSESIKECFNINYYGTKRMCKAMIPFLQLSDSPTIVNVSSLAGMLQNITDERAKTVLSNAEDLREEKVDELLNECLVIATTGGQSLSNFIDGYTISKAAVNAYTRILSKSHPFIRTNAVCPGYVNTDMTFNMGFLSIEEGADSIVNLALSCNSSLTGKIFRRKEESSF